MSTNTPLTEAMWASSRKLPPISKCAKAKALCIQLETSLAEANREKAQLAEQLAAERALGAKREDVLRELVALIAGSPTRTPRIPRRVLTEATKALAATPDSAASELAAREAAVKQLRDAAIYAESVFGAHNECRPHSLGMQMAVEQLGAAIKATSGEGNPEARKPSDGREVIDPNQNG